MRIAPTHKAFDTYEAALATYQAHDAPQEGTVRFAFQTLLNTFVPTGWALLGEQTLPNGARPDAVLRDDLHITRGYWEAKDSGDDLDEEIRKKIQRGYPLTNTIFEDTRRAVLYQDKHPVLDIDLRDRQKLADLLQRFFSHSEPDIEEFHRAVAEFKERIPQLAQDLEGIIHRERAETNIRFIQAFNDFAQLCRTSIDPNISDTALEEMLVQHLLTERLFRTIFNNPDFRTRNVIANEIERVIAALTSRSFNRDEFLSRLDTYYRPIEEAAKGITDWSEKQAFLNTVYERFFQGFSTKQADTHGIVYTPQEIVDFMVNSVEEVLQTEFGQSLATPGVCILDPATGTGNFIVNIMRRITNPVALKQKYQHDLFANEIMLLPYYIAAMNIEHEYYVRTEEYAPFDGLCFADTLDMESTQMGLFSEANTARIQRENAAPIRVIIGNPPYNVGQRNENDNNKNRRYKSVSDRITATYAKDSRASNRNALSDVYVKFFRWATDRLRGQDGIVCFVSNNSFVDQIAFDGMRKHLLQDFTRIWHLDLHGNVRQNPKISGTSHNVFGIQVGVGITLCVKKATHTGSQIRYYRVPEMWRKTEKLASLNKAKGLSGIDWQELQPDSRHNWRTDKMHADYELFIALGTKEAKTAHTIESETIFKTYSRGLQTTRDAWVYDFDRGRLATRVRSFIETYNAEVDRWKRRDDSAASADNFVLYDDARTKWSEGLKGNLVRGRHAQFSEQKIRRALYRPYSKQWLFFDRLLNERVYQIPHFFPTTESESQNMAIWIKTGSEVPMFALATNAIPDLLPQGGSQCFPLYTYNEDGSGKRENITDWALGQFRARYGADVTKQDIFHYVYALLHHPTYRERYAENLKRDLPRIPYVPDAETFRAFVAAGARLADLHLHYETAPEYQLDWQQAEGATYKSLFHVQQMKLTKDKTAVVVNPSLTLAGIPPEAFQYRLGNRSALEWVIDQYRITTEARSGITSDPNRPDDPEYIVRLIGRVLTVSLETVQIVANLPPLPEPGENTPSG